MKPPAYALRALEIVRESVGEEYDPVLYPPGHEGPFWCISLEGAGEWSLEASESWPEGTGIWAEPVFSWCLAVYEEA